MVLEEHEPKRPDQPLVRFLRAEAKEFSQMRIDPGHMIPVSHGNYIIHGIPGEIDAGTTGTVRLSRVAAGENPGALHRKRETAAVPRSREKHRLGKAVGGYLLGKQGGSFPAVGHHRFEHHSKPFTNSIPFGVNGLSKRVVITLGFMYADRSITFCRSRR